jgi:uncharacterized C2H2 Zn-finger protein
MACPVCSLKEERLLENRKRRFFRCPRCGFVHAEFPPDEDQARRRYLLHHNDTEEYRTYLGGIIKRALTLCAEHGRRIETVLDFGSGPDEAAARILRGYGIQTDSWDPFFHPVPPQKEAYDLVLCIEAAEHFFNPALEFCTIADALNDGGLALLHTSLTPAADDEFLRWWYKEDSTHVSFYSELSLRMLAEGASLVLEGITDGSFIVMRKV